MKKQKFVDIIRDYQNVSPDDLTELIELEDDFPYSQAIRNLVAKGSFDNKTDDAKRRIGKAAIYATDRTVLRSLIENQLDLVEDGVVVADDTGAVTIEKKTEEVAKEPKAEPKAVDTSGEPIAKDVTEPKKEEVERTIASRPAEDEIENLRAEVLRNLEELQGYKKQLPEFFADLADDAPKTKTKGKKKPKAPSVKETRVATPESSMADKGQPAKAKKPAAKTKAATSPSKATSKTKKPTTKKTVKPKPRTSKIAKPTAAATKKTTAKKTAESTTKTKAKAKTTARAKTAKPAAKTSKKKVETEPEIPSLDFLEESRKEKKGPKNRKSNKKRSEQDQIINEFISSESEIKINPEKVDELAPDLSVKSAELNEELVSENLAMILTKQGKPQKAIEIYKKLIWKFPQKKAYFASQIESLRKD